MAPQSKALCFPEASQPLDGVSEIVGPPKSQQEAMKGQSRLPPPPRPPPNPPGLSPITCARAQCSSGWEAQRQAQGELLGTHGIGNQTQARLIPK